MYCWTLERLRIYINNYLKEYVLLWVAHLKYFTKIMEDSKKIQKKIQKIFWYMNRPWIMKYSYGCTCLIDFHWLGNHCEIPNALPNVAAVFIWYWHMASRYINVFCSSNRGTFLSIMVQQLYDTVEMKRSVFKHALPKRSKKTLKTQKCPSYLLQARKSLLKWCSHAY